MTAELEHVILYLVYHSPKPLTKTSLMKFVYLADYQHYRLYGEQLTDSVWEVDQFGPVDYTISDTAWVLHMLEKLHIIPGRTGYGDAKIEYVPHPGSIPSIELGERASMILSRLLRTFGRWSTRRLANMCKLTEPFRVEPSIRQRLDMGLIEKAKELKDYPELQKLATRFSSIDLSERGSPEDRAAHIVQIYDELDGLRKRATTVVLEEK